MSAAAAPENKPRRIWLRLLLGVLAIAALLAGFQLFLSLRSGRERARGDAELAAAVAELDERDPRWRWEQMEADLAPIPDDENSALILQKAVAAWGKWEPSRDKYPGPLDDLPPANVRLDGARLRLIRDELGKLDDGLALAISLKDHPRGRSPVRSPDDFLAAIVHHGAPVRDAVYLLELDAERLLHDGRCAEVPDRLRAMLRAGARLRDGCMLHDVVVRVSARAACVRALVRCLGMGELSDEECRKLVAILGEKEAEEILLPALRGERAGHHRVFERLRSGDLSWDGLYEKQVSLGGPEKGERAAYSTRLAEDEAAFLTRMSEICAIARLPLERHRDAWAKIEAEISASRDAAELQRRRLLTHAFLPAIGKVGETVVRDRVRLRCAVAALAAERFRLENKRWPRELEELCPEYLPAVPRDPFGDGSLRLARREDGVLIYSVGKDGKDDGGDIAAFGEGDRGTDLGVRLYDADKRNLPAKE